MSDLNDQELLGRIKEPAGMQVPGEFDAVLSPGMPAPPAPSGPDAELLSRIKGTGPPTLTTVPRQPRPPSFFPATLGGPGQALTPAAELRPPSQAPSPTPGGTSPFGLQVGAGGITGLADLFAMGVAMLEAPFRFGTPGAGAYEVRFDKNGFVEFPEDPEWLSSQVSRNARIMLENAGVPEPQGGWETFQRKFGEEAMASGLPSLYILKRAKYLKDAGKAARYFPRLFSHAGNYPRLFLGEEAAGTLGSAAGRTMAGEDNPIAEMILGLAGGMTGSLSFQTLASAGRGLRLIKDLATSNVPRERAIARAAQRLQESAGRQGKELALDALARKMGLLEELPDGVTPTLGAVTNNSGILTLEGDLAARYPDFNIRLQMAKESGNDNLIRELIRRGEWYGSPVEEARSAARAYVERELKRIETEIGKLTPDMEPDDISKLWRSKLQKLHDDIYEPLNNRYDELSQIIDLMGEQFPAEHAKQAVTTVRTMEGRVAPNAQGEGGIQLKSSGEPTDLMQQIQNLPDDVPYGIMHRLRRMLFDEIKDTPRGERQKRKYLGVLLDGVVDDLSEVKQIGLERRRSPELRQITEELAQLDAQFKEYARVFRMSTQGDFTTTGHVLSKHGPAAEDMLNQYIAPGDALWERIANFKETFKDVPGATEAVEDLLVSLAYQTSADKLGNPTGSLANFKRRYRVQLREFPKAAERMRSLERLGEEAKALGIYGPRTRDQIERGAVKLFGDNPEDAIDKILKLTGHEAQGKAMAGLMRDIGAFSNPIRKGSLRRLLWDDMLDKVTYEEKDVAQQVLSGVRVRSHLQKYRGAFEQVYTEEELAHLEKLADAADMMQRIRVSIQQRTSKQEEALAGQFVQRTSVFSQISRPARKAYYTVRAMNWLQSKLLENEAQNVLFEALLDPRGPLARHLLMADSPNARRFLINWISKNMPTLVPRVAIQNEERRTALPGG